MSHEITAIDNVLLRKDRAWHGLGLIVDENLGAVEAARRAKMVWPVEQWALTATAPDGTTIPVNDFKANVRVDNVEGVNVREVLGVVSGGYRVCQNLELAELADSVAESGKVIIESCGSIRGGKRVWFLARGESFEVGGKDLCHSYMLFSNGHDGGSSLMMTPTSIRVVCSNTLHMVIPREAGEKPASASLSLRHVGSMAEKIKQAKAALRHFGRTTQQNIELMEKLNSTPISRMQANQLFAGSYAAFWETATKDEMNSGDGRVRSIAEKRMERMLEGQAAFLQRYDEERRKLGLGETVWAAMNAMTGFVQHDKILRAKGEAPPTLF